MCLVMFQAVNLVKKGQVEIQTTVSFSVKRYRSHLICGYGVFQNIALGFGLLLYFKPGINFTSNILIHFDNQTFVL